MAAWSDKLNLSALRNSSASAAFLTATKPTTPRYDIAVSLLSLAMTAAPPRAPPHSLQPRPKASPTTHPSFQSTPATTPRSSSSRPATPVSRLSHDHAASYYLSDKATAYLIRKTLCSPSADKNAPVSDLLPPLSSSNEVDLQLYAFIAIVIREFVYTWYAKITPDQTFVEEVVKIIAHCTRGLEQRLRKVDLEALVFDELPELLDAHVKGKYKIRRCCMRC